MKNVGDNHYLIYGFVDAVKLSGNAVYRTCDDGKGTVRHIISELSRYKMIPVPNGHRYRTDMTAVTDRFYSSILRTEHDFRKSRQDGILRRVRKTCDEQTITGTEHERYRGSKRLEEHVTHTRRPIRKTGGIYDCTWHFRGDTDRTTEKDGTMNPSA